MYHISKTTHEKNTSQRGRFVLLEHLPPILSPKILTLVFLYAMAFSLLLIGLKMLHLESRLSDATANLTSIIDIDADTSSPLYQQESNVQIQQGIAKQVIRLHVIANSDSEKDQTLKLKVRDAIIQDLQDELKEADTVDDARSTILAQMPQIEERAREVILEEGYDYSTEISLGTQYFPTKVYGDLSFPAGNYEALCLRIGKADGHNWWCVLFPSLCFVDETYAVVPEESKEKLRTSLTEEEYQSLEIHSAVYDWIQKN